MRAVTAKIFRRRNLLPGVLSLFFWSISANALPERPVSIDMGAGLPQLLALQGQVAPSPHWQIGLSYGMIPGLSPVLKVEAQNVKLADGFEYQVTPTVKASLYCLTPFVRYYPSDNNFYFQVGYSMLHVKMDITSGVTLPGSSTILGFFNGEVDLVQALPTISIGNVFAGKVYFFNIALGVTFIANVSSDVALQSMLPDALGGATGNEDAINEIKSKFSDTANEASKIYRNQYSFIPSIMVSFGLIL